MARLVNRHGTVGMEAEIVAAAIRTAGQVLGQCSLPNENSQNIEECGRIVGKLAKAILEELRKD